MDISEDFVRENEADFKVWYDQPMINGEKIEGFKSKEDYDNHLKIIKSHSKDE